MAILTITDLKRVRKGLEARNYDHTRFGRPGSCGCTLGEIAKVKRLYDENRNYAGKTAAYLLRETPGLSRFGRTINRLLDAGAHVTKTMALNIVDRFIGALRRYNHAAR